MMETNSEEVEEDNLDHTDHHEILFFFFLTRAPKTTGGTRPNNKTVDRTPIPKTNNNQQLITLQYPIRWDTSRRTSRSVYQQSGKDNESPLAVIRNTRRLSDSITQETISMEIEENSPQYLGTASSERRYKQVFDSGHYRNFTNSVKQLPFNFFHYTRKKKKKKQTTTYL